MATTQAMSQAIQREAQDVRARERYPYYDTVAIGPGAGTREGWFNTFSDMAAQDEIFLFNIRNRANVGSAYCNLDSPSLFDVGYLIDSIGVSLEAPLTQGWINNQGSPVPNPAPFSVWQELIEHLSVQLFLNQDEKVAFCGSLLPAGHGVFGPLNTVQAGFLVASNHLTGGNYSNGIPDHGNRWQFAKPIEVPRNHSVRAIVRFSEYARRVLLNLQGPGYVQLNSGGVSGPGWTAAQCGIRVTVDGTRLVQLRNAQTYR